MKKNTPIAFYGLAVLLLVSMAIGCNNASTTTVKDAVSDSMFLANAGSLAMNHPDQFNWEVFARVCGKASFQETVPGTKDTTNNAIWETWADDELTYPQEPNPASPPQFPTGTVQKKKALAASTQQSIARHFRKMKGVEFVEKGGSEEVRRNASSFNFIIQNGLWYTQGLAASFAKGTANGQYAPLSFPLDAIEVKGMWTPIQEKDKPKYHWNYDVTGKLYGLTALHIMTKAIPNWTWATWEWFDNKGRCDDMGCHDSFGVDPANVNPHPGATNQPSPHETGTPYPAGTMTTALAEIFKKYNLGDEWKNYRLKGSQTDWIDATGRAVLLGNSITEDGFVTTSSCITCHSNASFDSTGAFNPTVGFLPSGQSQYGAVDSNIFWKNGKQILYQGDFVWGLFKAKPAKGK